MRAASLVAPLRPPFGSATEGHGQFRHGVFLRSKESPESAVTNVIAFRRRVPMSTDVTTDVTEGFLVEMDGDLSHRNLEETEGSAAA